MNGGLNWGLLGFAIRFIQTPAASTPNENDPLMAPIEGQLRTMLGIPAGITTS